MGIKARFWAFVAGFGGASAAILAFLFAREKEPEKLDLEKIKSETEVKIENMQAQDLVNASDRADQHHATVGRIKSELRDKATNHLQDLLGSAGD